MNTLTFSRKKKEHSFATYAYSYRICLLESFIVCRLKNNNKCQWANAAALRACYVMLQMNPPKESALLLLLLFFSLSLKARVAMRFTAD